MSGSFVVQSLLSRYNQPFVSAIIAALLAQVLKVAVARISGDKRPIAALFMSGGIPSSHAALAFSLFTSVVWHQGWASPTTGVTGILVVLVLYDATVIRRATEEHARMLRLLMQRVAPDEIDQFKLTRSLGHTPFEVTAGAVLGIAVSRVVLWLGTL